MNSIFPEFTNEEIFKVLMCGKKPIGGYTIAEYVEEWNLRVENGMTFEVSVPPLE